MLLTGLLMLACSACFLIYPRSASQRSELHIHFIEDLGIYMPCGWGLLGKNLESWTKEHKAYILHVLIFRHIGFYAAFQLSTIQQQLFLFLSFLETGSAILAVLELGM